MYFEGFLLDVPEGANPGYLHMHIKNENKLSQIAIIENLQSTTKTTNKVANWLYCLTAKCSLI